MMTTPATLSRYLKWLDEQIVEAKNNAEASFAKKSLAYSDGYANGEIQALERARDYFSG